MISGGRAQNINSLSGLPLCGSTQGVYGDVQRVKILYNKKDSALIQMADGHQSQLGKATCALLASRGSCPPAGTGGSRGAPACQCS